MALSSIPTHILLYYMYVLSVYSVSLNHMGISLRHDIPLPLHALASSAIM